MAAKAKVARPRKRAESRAVADRRAREALKLRTVDKLTYKEIGDRLGISAPAALDAYRRGCLLDMPREEIAEARSAALQQYDLLEQIAWDILRSEHPLVSWGRRIEGVSDDGPRLAALDRLIKIERRRAEIQGYDSPKRKELTVITEDVVDREIQRLEGRAGCKSRPCLT